MTELDYQQSKITHLFFLELDIDVTDQMVTKIVANVHLFNLEELDGCARRGPADEESASGVAE